MQISSPFSKLPLSFLCKSFLMAVFLSGGSGGWGLFSCVFQLPESSSQGVTLNSSLPPSLPLLRTCDDVRSTMSKLHALCCLNCSEPYTVTCSWLMKIGVWTRGGSVIMPRPSNPEEGGAGVAASLPCMFLTLENPAFPLFPLQKGSLLASL